VSTVVVARDRFKIVVDGINCVIGDPFVEGAADLSVPPALATATALRQ
jgi:hypothetical protein